MSILYTPYRSKNSNAVFLVLLLPPNAAWLSSGGATSRSQKSRAKASASHHETSDWLGPKDHINARNFQKPWFVGFLIMFAWSFGPLFQPT